MQQAAASAALMGWACEAAGVGKASEAKLVAKVLLLAGVRRAKDVKERKDVTFPGRTVTAYVHFL